MEELKLWMHLLATPDLGRKKSRKLLDIFGKPQNFIGFNKNLFADLSFLTEKQKLHLSRFETPLIWPKVNELINKYDIKYLSCLNEQYPACLHSIYDPPIVLFYRGKLKENSIRRSLAVVGTRRPSNYGKLTAKKISSAIAEAGFTIVSGLAYGIDSIAHRSAIEHYQRTVAVMATGVDQIYPRGNHSLASEIIKNGAVISEYIPGSKAEKWFFPTRNRIISGLCMGCIVVEGSKKSGALLTAKFALDQNRDVFALPGDINRPQSEGPNYLIKIGAKPVTSINDILEEYDVLTSENSKQIPSLDDKEKQIFQLLLNNRPEVGFDNLLIASGMNVNTLSSVLLTMELKSVIKQVQGNKFSLI